MAYLSIFGLEFSKPLAVFEITTLKFVQLRNFAKREKCLNLEPKMTYMGIFQVEV